MPGVKAEDDRDSPLLTNGGGKNGDGTSHRKSKVGCSQNGQVLGRCQWTVLHKYFCGIKNGGFTPDTDVFLKVVLNDRLSRR